MSMSFYSNFLLTDFKFILGFVHNEPDDGSLPSHTLSAFVFFFFYNGRLGDM